MSSSPVAEEEQPPEDISDEEEVEVTEGGEEQDDGEEEEEEKSGEDDMNEDNDEEEEEESTGDAEEEGGGDDEEEKSGDDVNEENDDEVVLGGPVDVPCLALLDGFMGDPYSTDNRQRVTVPIDRLPATIGRSHEEAENDRHFFGLGPQKTISRNQFKLTYRDPTGGCVEWKGAKLQYVPAPAGRAATDDKEKSTDSATKNLPSDLPEKGAFVIECVGKNRMQVGTERIGPGEMAVVTTSGCPLRVSNTTMIYLFLPDDAESQTHVHTRQKPQAKTSTTKTAKPKKNAAEPDSATSTSNKKPKKTAGRGYQAELDAMPIQELLDLMNEAIEADKWERQHQLIGATIAVHSVRDAARDPVMQQSALESGGVARSDVMTWIEDDEVRYGTWVRQLQTTMEPRSYQAAMTKALLKGGYTRAGSGSGRYIKWLLPDDIPIKDEVKEAVRNKKRKAPGESDSPVANKKPSVASKMKQEKDDQSVSKSSDHSNQSNSEEETTNEADGDVGSEPKDDDEKLTGSQASSEEKDATPDAKSVDDAKE